MFRSQKLRNFWQGIGLARASAASGVPAADLIKREQDAQAAAPRKIGRRPFIGMVGAAAGAMAVGSIARPARAISSSHRQPVIAIIGAGISGLCAALELQDNGVASTVYEASGQVGGRIHSNTNWKDGQTSEWCGEFLDSGHLTMIGLAQRFGLTLVDEVGAQPAGSTDTLYFFEKYYADAQAYADFQAIAKSLERDANKLYPTTYDPSTQSKKSTKLDNMSAFAWIDEYVPGGHSSPLGAYIDSAYTNEFGLDTDQQSALNIVYEMGFQDDPSVFSIYGESDQRYHVLGGNDQVPKAIANSLPGDSIKTGWRMECIALRSDGRYELTFATPYGTRVVTADHVIMTNPFSVLRGLDYAKADFDPLKQTAITQLGYGTNSKLIMQMTSRLWNTNGPWGLSDGNIYTDLSFQNVWDSSRGIPGHAGVLVLFNGGSEGEALGNAKSPWATDEDPAVRAYVAQNLALLKEPWPGIEKLWNGKATLSTPWRDPNLLGSYSCWLVGQYSLFSGYEGVRQGNCHFAGEHTSTQGFQGFMEGGAQEGQRAADEILSDIGIM